MKEILSLKDLSMNIGEFFQTFRKKENKTQAEIGKISGLSDGYISQIEQGKRDKMINIETADKIANAIFLPTFPNNIYIDFINEIIEGRLNTNTCFLFTSWVSKLYANTPSVEKEVHTYECGDNTFFQQPSFLDEKISLWILSFLGASQKRIENLKRELRKVENDFKDDIANAPKTVDIYEYLPLEFNQYDMLMPECTLLMRENKKSFLIAEQFVKEKKIFDEMYKQINFLNKNIYNSKTSTSFLLSSNIGENPVIKRMIDIFQDVPMTDVEQMLLNNTLDNIEEMRKK